MTARVAVIGCGLIGRKRALALQAAGATDFTFHDLDADRCASLAHDLGGAVCKTAEAAVQDAELAVIATVHSALTSLGGVAVEAGCHVLVEKPGSSRHASLAILYEQARARDRVVRVGYNHRFHPAMLHAKELIDSGSYGPIMNIRGRYGHGGRLGYEHEWRTDREVSGGGELLDQGVHLIDLVRFFAGDVSLAFSALRTDFWDIPVEDNAFVALNTKDAALAWLHASWTEWKNIFSLEIALRTAKIEITGLGGSYGVERLTLHEMFPEMGPPFTSSWEWPRGDESWQREVDDVLAALEGKPGVGATIDDALAVLAIVEEAYRS